MSKIRTNCLENQHVQAGTINDKYRVLDFIGGGGTACVYLVRRTDDPHQYALKLLQDNYFQSNFVREQFRQEGERLLVLNHPNIVRFYDLFVGVDYAYLMMEYVDGYELGEILRNLRMGQNFYPINEAVRTLVQASRAINFLHENDLIHRDIKAANILLQKRTGKVYLVDFGIATEASEAATAFNAGTRAYMPPEQQEDLGIVVDRRADLYAFGIMAFEMLVGERPFRPTKGLKGKAAEQDLIDKHREAPVPSLKSYRDELPADLDPIFEKVLAKNPQDRYPNVRAFIEDLHQALFPLLVPELHDIDNIAPIDPETTMSMQSVPRQLGQGIPTTGMPLSTQQPTTGGVLTQEGDPQKLPWSLIALVVVLLILAGGVLAMGSGLVGGEDEAASNPTLPPPTESNLDISGLSDDLGANSGTDEVASPQTEEPDEVATAETEEPDEVAAAETEQPDDVGEEAIITNEDGSVALQATEVPQADVTEDASGEDSVGIVVPSPTNTPLPTDTPLPPTDTPLPPTNTPTLPPTEALTPTPTNIPEVAYAPFISGAQALGIAAESVDQALDIAASPDDPLIRLNVGERASYRVDMAMTSLTDVVRYGVAYGLDANATNFMVFSIDPTTATWQIEQIQGEARQPLASGAVESPDQLTISAQLVGGAHRFVLSEQIIQHINDRYQSGGIGLWVEMANGSRPPIASVEVGLVDQDAFSVLTQTPTPANVVSGERVLLADIKAMLSAGDLATFQVSCTTYVPAYEALGRYLGGGTELVELAQQAIDTGEYIYDLCSTGDVSLSGVLDMTTDSQSFFDWQSGLTAIQDTIEAMSLSS